jgi:eukaryotic-like serine/threonine-protein kinase
MLGPYRIAGVIGEGGMGVVYRARDTRLGRDVAIKVLTHVATDDRERLQRFEQEARATGMLNHPNLLTIYDVGHDAGGAYIVSELLEGETLRDRLARGPLAPRRALDAALQVAHGLAAAHEKGIVHRDLKPENIFLTRDGRAKILDFGIAKLSASAEGAFKSAATEPGMVLGTVGYMSPEQVRGELVDTRSDIFSFGVILYEILSGARAFKRDTSIETLRAILKEDPPELTEKLPNIPAPLERLVRRCLEKDRDLRFQSARDLAFNLETLSSVSTPGTLARAPVQTATMRIPTPPATPTAASTSTPRARTSTIARPAFVPPKRRVSPVLLALLYVVSIGGAAYGGWYFANRMKASVGEVTFQRLTFRRGEVHNARFAPDGDTIVYSAAWDGGPSEIFVTNRRSPEARPLGVSNADVLGVARTTEIAVLLRRDRASGLGTLARIPLAGGTPREVAEQVLQADWSPDGADLVAIRVANGKYLLESPVGRVRYETPHQISYVRVAPDGRIAFSEWYGGKVDIAVLDPKAAKPAAVARGWRHGANGLAWSPDGKEIWITGTDTAAPPALYAVNADTGETRLVSRFTGLMKLFDISPAAHVLLSTGLWRAALEYQAPGETAERDMSWLDWSTIADLSRDGTKLLFNETREGGGAANAIYLRTAASPAPVRIGDGMGDALSPDGKFVLAHNGPRLAVIPTGSGEARDLKVDGSFAQGAVWVPNSARVIVAGALPQKGYQLLRIDTLDETVKPISPENIWGDAYRPFAVSPDGRTVAGMTGQQTIALYDVEGAAAPVGVAGVEPGEVPIQWSADAASLFVYRPNALPTRVYRVTLATGAREPWKEFTPIDPAGVYRIAPICMNPDGSAYAYDALRILSDLYVANGLK